MRRRSRSAGWIGRTGAIVGFGVFIASSVQASPLRVCQRLVITAPAPGATQVPIDFIGAMAFVEDPACSLGRETETVVLVDGEQVLETAWISPFTPMAITPLRPLEPNRRYEMQVRVGEVITSSTTFTTGEFPFEPPVLTSFSLVVDRSSGTTEQHQAQLRLNVASLGGVVGPIDVGFGEDEVAASRGVYPMSDGTITRHVGLLVLHPGDNVLNVALGNEETWPHPRTCAVVRALIRNDTGGCLHPESGCLREQGRLTACADSPTGCSVSGKPGLEALLLFGLAWWLTRTVRAR